MLNTKHYAVQQVVLYLMSGLQYKGVVDQYLLMLTAEHTFPTYREITDKEGSALHKSIGFLLLSLNRKILQAHDKLYTRASEIHDLKAFHVLCIVSTYIYDTSLNEVPQNNQARAGVPCLLHCVTVSIFDTKTFSVQYVCFTVQDEPLNISDHCQQFVNMWLESDEQAQIQIQYDLIMHNQNLACIHTGHTTVAE